MPMFHDLKPAGDGATLRAAAGLVVRRAAERNLWPGSAPWSTAELHPDEHDVAWLVAWADALKPSAVRECVRKHWWDFPVGPDRVTYMAALGLLLTTLTAEVARREAADGTLWRFVRRDEDGQLRFPAADADLFTGNHPGPAFKEALAVAARSFGLRHRYDSAEDAEMRYYLSIFLQFGVTYRDALARLPEWLALGGPSQRAAQMLLGQDGTALRSASFVADWRRLESQADAGQIAASPWFPSEWAEDLATLTRKPRPVVPRGPAAHRPPIGPVVETDPDAFIPLLRWPHGERPRFVVLPGALGALGLDSDEYRLRLSGREAATLIQSFDGSFECYPPEVPLAGPAADVAAELIDGDGGTAWAGPITVWCPDDEVVLFDLTDGRQVMSGANPRVGRDYALLYPADTRLEPEPADSHRFERPAMVLSRVAGSELRAARVVDDDGPLWQWDGTAAATRPIPIWAGRVSIVVRDGRRSLRLGESVRLRIYHPADVTVASVRGPSRFWRPEPDGPGRSSFGPYAPPNETTGHPVSLHLLLTRGEERVRHKVKLEVEVVGALQLRGDYWVVAGKDGPISVFDAESSAFRILTPSRWNDQAIERGQWALMEGQVWVGRPRVRPHPVGGLSGLGAGLTVRNGPFNNLGGDAFELAGEVVDRGVVLDSRIERKADSTRRVVIELTSPIEPSPRHRVVVWEAGGSIRQIDPRGWRPEVEAEGEPPGQVRNDWWVADLPVASARSLAVAIAFDGHRLGATWAGDWHNALADPNALGPGRLASLVRWFRLPLLSRASARAVKAFALTHPTAALGAWVLDGDDADLVLPLADEGWLGAVRDVFHDWEPVPEQVEALTGAIELLGGDGLPIVGLALALHRVDPRLMAKVVRTWLFGGPESVGRAPRAPYLLAMIRKSLVGARTDLSVAQAQPHYERLKEAACKQMQARDDNFVVELLREAEAAFRRRKPGLDPAGNIEVAVAGVEVFRNLLGVKLLDSLEPKH